VRWVETVQAIRARGVSHIIECGPGKVLAGMVKRIDGDAVTATVLDPSSLCDALGLLA
jgi:[acyl-carrier-protein] S-malonyltransferase